LWEFEVGPMEKVINPDQMKPHAKFEDFWTSGKSSYKVSWSFGILERIPFGPGPTH
jgi:hypothetical protein